ncbi:MAG: NB-ARC domain-containing protein [Xenococcaceae cyanobacterium]
MVNFSKIVEELDLKVFAKKCRHFKEAEKIILWGAWSAKTYEQMTENSSYSLNYLKQAVGPTLWKLLSEVLETEISKTNFRSEIEKRWKTVSEQNFIDPDPKIFNSFSITEETFSKHQDWGEAPNLNNFYGRTKELATLKQWLVRDRCRTIAIVGMGGIGKTSLSVSCARQMKDEFQIIIWRSLHYAPTLDELLTNLLQALFSKQKLNIPTELENKFFLFLDCLRRQRCLIVLDTATAILQSGDLAGHYRENYQDYSKFFTRIAQEPHQSCLIITTREKPRDIAILEGENSPVRSLHLNSLKEEAKEILKEKKLLEPQRWNELITLYRGNPLVLKIVATTIKDLFAGRVSAFLQAGTLVFGDLNDILDEQLERLSAMEEEVFYWLALSIKPVSLARLRELFISFVTQAELIEALGSLLRRSLIEKKTIEEETRFSIEQPIAQYVIRKVVEKIVREIQEAARSKKIDRFELLRSHALIDEDESNTEIKELRSRLILTSVKERLYRVFRNEREIEAQLQNSLALLQGQTPLTIGYIKENLISLLAAIKSDLALLDRKMLNKGTGL